MCNKILVTSGVLDNYGFCKIARFLHCMQKQFKFYMHYSMLDIHEYK